MLEEESEIVISVVMFASSLAIGNLEGREHAVHESLHVGENAAIGLSIFVLDRRPVVGELEILPAKFELVASPNPVGGLKKLKTVLPTALHALPGWQGDRLAADIEFRQATNGRSRAFLGNAIIDQARLSDEVRPHDVCESERGVLIGCR